MRKTWLLFLLMLVAGCITEPCERDIWLIEVPEGDQYQLAVLQEFLDEGYDCPSYSLRNGREYECSICR